MKTKIRLCRLLCSKLLLLTVFCSLGLLECLRWLQQPQAPREIQPLETKDLKIAKLPAKLHQAALPGIPAAPPPAAPALPAGRPPGAPRKTRRVAVRKILLLAYARSGSSFTGELLSALPRAAYYYEPLFSLRPNGTAIENVIMRDPTKSVLVQKQVEGVFSCSWALLQQLNKGNYPTIRKRGMSCRKSNPRVMKTIRLRRAGLEPWIHQTDIKIVHLVRDPRAMITSLSQRPGVWSILLRNSTFQCKRMLDDMKLEDSLPKERYIRVRYEDLVDQTDASLHSLYEHLGLPWTNHVRGVVFSHTHAENVTGTNGHGYYNTFRSSNFAHDSWKRRLRPKTISAIEQGCEEFMGRAGYSPYTQTQEEQQEQREQEEQEVKQGQKQAQKVEDEDSEHPKI